MGTMHLYRVGTIIFGLLSAPCAAQQFTATNFPTAVNDTWLNRGGDIPVDQAWHLGVLANGLRYAVRRSSEPAGAISVRVRIGVGGLMESDTQQGWSHFIEHMVFRGTARCADGEGVKLWQRLGASFGSDTNAQTTLTATTFQLDLPHPTSSDYGQAMTVLAEMMDSARMDPALLITERHVVEAELAQRSSPLMRKIKDAQQPLFLAGTKAATRDVIGTPETLAGATSSALKGYYKQWYRPDNAVLVVVGDADPVELEVGITRAFGGWKATGQTPPAPDWGTPETPTTSAAIVTDPQAPGTLALSFVASHPIGPFTIARQQQQFDELVASNVLNQRFAAAAREDKAIVNAGVQRLEQVHIEDQFVVAAQSKPDQWQATLNQIYTVLNGIVAHPPSQAEVDEQVSSIANTLDQAQRSVATQSAPALATSFVTDVDNGDVAGPREFYTHLFKAQRSALTPAAVSATLKRLLAPAPRLMVMGPQPIAGGIPIVVSALASAQKVAGGNVDELRAVSLDQLVLRGSPSSIAAIVPVVPLGAERVMLRNGVELTFKQTLFEKGRVRVRVEVGAGMLGEAAGRPGLWWTAGALPAAGIGPFSTGELARVVAGHQYGFAANQGLGALSLTGVTDIGDLPGMLKLMTGAIVAPRFDVSVINRVRESALANYASIFSQPGGVFQAFGGAPLHGGDARFDALPSRDAIAKLTFADFRQFWTRRLEQGPVRVTIVGDVSRDSAATAVAATLGTLALRPATIVRHDDVRATLPAKPVIFMHDGNPEQALIALVWPTLGELDDAQESTALDVAASIVQTRLTEGFRATEGGGYSPFAIHAQSDLLPHYGAFIAGAQVQASHISDFSRALDRSISELVAKGPSTDELSRAQATAVGAVQRSRESNEWWLEELSSLMSDGFNAKRVSNMTNDLARLKAVDVESVERVVGLYIVNIRRSQILTLPHSVHAKKEVRF